MLKSDTRYAIRSRNFRAMQIYRFHLSVVIVNFISALLFQKFCNREKESQLLLPTTRETSTDTITWQTLAFPYFSKSPVTVGKSSEGIQRPKTTNANLENLAKVSRQIECL